MSQNQYTVEYTSIVRAACHHKRCRRVFVHGELRIGKRVEGATGWYHASCMFEQFERCKSGTRCLESERDFERGWDQLLPEHQQVLRTYMENCVEMRVLKRRKAAADAAAPDQTTETPSVPAQAAADTPSAPPAVATSVQ